MRYAAFLAYPDRYAVWAQTLQGHLEGLLRGREPAEIFDGELDLTPGHLRLDEIQKGMESSDALLFITAPEMLCSLEMMLEWQAFLSELGRPVVVGKLIDTPLPRFLKALVQVDFREHDAERYHKALKRLVCSLRPDASLPPGRLKDLEPPPWPDPGVPAGVRQRVVNCLEPLLRRTSSRQFIAKRLTADDEGLEGFPDARLAASAALVERGGDAGEPVKRMCGIVETLRGACLEDENAETATRLEAILSELRALKTPSSSADDPRLAAWWEHVAAEHRRLADHFERPEELRILEEAWVELEVRPELEHLAPPAKGERSAKDDLRKGEVPMGPLSIDSVLALERGAAPWMTGRWLLEGEPGAGKTTLLRHLASRLAGDARDPRRLPVFVSLPRFLAPGQELPLLGYLAAGFELSGLSGMADFLKDAGGAGRLVVLLDGLDEVPPERRDGFEVALKRLLGDWPDCPMILASRPLGQGDVPSGFPKLRLLPLASERRREFLAKWFRHGRFDDPDVAASEAFDYFERRPGLRELAGNPLYLTLLATLWEREIRAPERRVELYERIFQLLLGGGYKKNPVRIEAPKTVREALAHLAHGLTVADLAAEAPEDLEDRLREPELEALRQRLETVARWRGRLRTFLDDVYERTHLLGPHDGRDSHWSFWHRTFREALTAEKLHALHAGGGESAILDLVSNLDKEGEGRWAEPLALLAGRLGAGADAFVLRLGEANGRLGRRALATAQDLEPETLREMLGRCSSFEERSEVFLRLPEHFTEPGDCLKFIDELRRATRDGNDLFFLSCAALQVGQRWPEAAAQVTGLRARFYDHIPAPPEDLFRWIETRQDGRAELWRDIPSGRFLMGSPADEEERLESEGPQHEVEVTSGFRLSAVPVTVEQYAAFDPAHTSYFQDQVPEGEFLRHPVERVTWYAAFSFCAWLSAQFSWSQCARLPTEEEWEYACRAGSETRYWSGDREEDLARVGWYDENSDDQTHRVGEKPANPWGLYDIHGNVDEWTLSEWTADYSSRENGFKMDPATVSPAVAGLAAVSRGGGRVFRGGSYLFTAQGTRSAYRFIGDPGNGIGSLGFRVCLPFPRAGA